MFHIVTVGSDQTKQVILGTGFIQDIHVMRLRLIELTLSPILKIKIENYFFNLNLVKIIVKTFDLKSFLFGQKN